MDFSCAGHAVGTFFSFVLGIFNPYVTNKAGPDWLWAGGRDDVIRNLYLQAQRQLSAATAARRSLPHFWPPAPTALFWLPARLAEQVHRGASCTAVNLFYVLECPTGSIADTI